MSAACLAAASPAVSPTVAALAGSGPSRHPAVAAFRGARAAHSHRLALSCKVYRVHIQGTFSLSIAAGSTRGSKAE